jgi:hypothetical protein
MNTQTQEQIAFTAADARDKTIEVISTRNLGDLARSINFSWSFVVEKIKEAAEKGHFYIEYDMSGGTAEEICSLVLGFSNAGFRCDIKQNMVRISWEHPIEIKGL